MENKGNSKCDPGWNDPPLFSYNLQTSHLNSKPRTLLNKRVAFPLNEASAVHSQNVPVDPTAPLPTCNPLTLPPPPAGAQISTKDDSSKDKPVIECNTLEIPLHALETVINNFNEVMDKLFENKDKDKVEVTRRLDVMRKMWLEDKLCKDIQQRLIDLAEALKNNEIEKADDLQKSLMVDFGSACSPWMSGVRCLIHHNQPGD